MASLESRVAKLRAFNASLERGRTASRGEILEEGLMATERPPTQQALAEESIILRKRRPVLAIRDDSAVLEFATPEDASLWKQPLDDAKELLTKACAAVGRIDLTGHEEFQWIGTGWLVAPDVMVTNRHVALAFADRGSLAFRTSVLGAIGASIDFRRELNSDAARLFEVLRPLHIEASDGPDLAFFQVELSSAAGQLSPPIELSKDFPTGPAKVSVIGYPASDSRIPEQDLMNQIYGQMYDFKRLAPGEVTSVESGRILHNCTTLGGNSGSAVVDLTSGRALGLHFSGRFLETNYAVRADVVAQRLASLREEKRRGRSAPTPAPAPRPRAGVSLAGGASTTLTVPLTITVSVGAPAAGAVRVDVRPSPAASDVAVGPDADEDIAEESRPADYSERDGYLASFLGSGLTVKLPDTAAVSDDVLRFIDRGKSETELRYEHFSVVMSESRRMCLFSAANIDGAASKKTKRMAWRTDPRIPKQAQILKECYGDPPKFSRGHMTRREDPAWGDAATAQRGNTDSMHVTNTTPQMQAFNSPIWLQLEDYALQHARQDDMKISVFTGPYFDYDGVADPAIDQVRIPRVFWKIIAFVHDETGKLCATGYEMSQEDNLPKAEEEFVFGTFVSSYVNRSVQVSIASIERRTSLKFGRLAAIDPLASDEEAIAVPRRLDRLEHIRFR